MALQRSRSRRPVRRGAVALVAGLALATAAPAAAQASGARAAVAQTSVSATKAKISANWVAFFSGRTSAARKIALLQDGSRFAAVIRGQAGSALAKSVTAKVATVTLVSKTKANVRYSIALGGKTALANQRGQAVLQAGTWKVGDASFCALLALEQVKAPACPKS